MLLKPTIIAIPFFALMIALEAWYAYRRGAYRYESRDAWTNIGLGFGSVAWGAFFGLLTGLIYILFLRTGAV